MIKKIGFQSVLTDNYDLISKSKTLIFPGVGNFDNVMSKIYEKKIDKAIYNSLENNSKLLGICLGMQALFSRSEEGKLEGLNLIKGQILKFNFNESNNDKEISIIEINSETDFVAKNSEFINIIFLETNINNTKFLNSKFKNTVFKDQFLENISFIKRK